MPFLMIRNDITRVAADAIVNPANRDLLQGSGTSRAIYQAAGEQELAAACEAIGYCELGRAVCTPAFGRPAPLESERVAAKTEPYPGRWTTHFVLHCTAELDEELFDWVGQAYQFAQIK